MEFLTKELEKELLEGLLTLDIYSSEFDHCLEYNNVTYATIEKYIETENLNITIEIGEKAIWSAYDDYESDEIFISFLEVTCDNGLLDTDSITDDELLKYIKY